MLICDNISCIRGEKPVFAHLGFCLQEGALLLLKGPNGSGKTSLLEIVSGKLPPAQGHILWNGKPIAGNAEFARDMMAIGHENTADSNVTVQESLMECARRYDSEMLVPAALRFFDLDAMKDKRASELSAGWRRRAALAQLIVAPCKLWLLDEPTDFLDEEAVLLTVSLIESRVKQGGIVIAASHSLNSAMGAHVLELEDFQIMSLRA